MTSYKGLHTRNTCYLYAEERHNYIPMSFINEKFNFIATNNLKNTYNNDLRADVLNEILHEYSNCHSDSLKF